MSARESAATEKAVELSKQPGYSIVRAAKEAGVSTSTLKRALRRRDIAPRPVKTPTELLRSYRTAAGIGTP